MDPAELLTAFECLLLSHAWFNSYSDEIRAEVVVLGLEIYAM